MNMDKIINHLVEINDSNEQGIKDILKETYRYLSEYLIVLETSNIKINPEKINKIKNLKLKLNSLI